MNIFLTKSCVTFNMQEHYHYIGLRKMSDIKYTHVQHTRYINRYETSFNTKTNHVSINTIVLLQTSIFSLS